MELLADTHVHVHPGCDVGRLLDAAARNFGQAASVPNPADRLEILCLTDVRGQQADRTLGETLHPAGAWRLAFSSDRASVCATHPNGRRIHFLPGRQIVSRENLELLALGCRLEPEDRVHGLSDLMDQVLAEGGVPVVPWGFGKWLGARGRVVRELMAVRHDFLLADNGNRLRGTQRPALLEQGRRLGFGILSGSDPLPLKSQAEGAGSCGVRANLPESAADPARAFREMIRRKDWTMYGALTPLPAFVASQVRMQIAKRRRV